MKQRIPPFMLTVLILLFGLATPRPGSAQPPHFTIPDPLQRFILYRYAADTWQSFAAMTHPDTGLPADHVSADRVPAAYTSPTNIGVYLWSTLAARDLQIISRGEAHNRIGQALATLARLERHADSGQFYNWYDPTTGRKLTVWPISGDPLNPFLSSVDNAWLATALLMVAHAATPEQRYQAQAILNGMDFSCYYDPNARGPEVNAGLMRGGFWTTADAPAYAGNFPKGNYCGKGPDVIYTGHHYGTLNSETRIISYVAIALGQVPAAHYFALWRTFPNTCDWSWQEMSAPGVTRTYLGIEVYEGHYVYRDKRIVPSWGGSMFEALMPALVVPEAQWGAQSWGVNHPLYVQAQIEHGLDEARYGYWGFSPAQNPEEGYREWGVDPLGMDPGGYTSDQERTTVDDGFRDPAGAGYCSGREPQPLPTAYGRGVVTPHAAFLALEFAPQAALDNLIWLQQNFGAYGWGGFHDAIEVATGRVATSYLALDQGMIMAAISNALYPNRLKSYFTEGAVEARIRPLLTMEEFSAGP